MRSAVMARPKSVGCVSRGSTTPRPSLINEDYHELPRPNGTPSRRVRQGKTDGGPTGLSAQLLFCCVVTTDGHTEEQNGNTSVVKLHKR